MNDVLATEGLRDFADRLSSTQADRLARVMGYLAQNGSEAAIQILEEELAEVQDQLNATDISRNALTVRQKDLRAVLQDIDTQLASYPKVPSDVLQLRLLLQQLEAEVEEEIALTRPINLLASKARLRKEISRQRLMGKLASAVGQDLLGRTQDEIIAEASKVIQRWVGTRPKRGVKKW